MKNETTPRAATAVAAASAALALALFAWPGIGRSQATGSPASADPASMATRGDAAERDLVERGRYVVRITGCNDCHTAGYSQSGGQMPEGEWLQGDAVGFQGPWGTTYPSNLRLIARGMTEPQWVAYARTMRTRPPMPWFSVNAMSDTDLRAMYRFIVQLGAPGAPVPAYVPPGKLAPTPVIALVPQPPR